MSEELSPAARAAENAEWAVAANDVASAILSSRVREWVSGKRHYEVTIEEAMALQAEAYRWIPNAKEAWEAGHPTHQGPCRCRAEAIAIVGASWESRATGARYLDLMSDVLHKLSLYLDSRS